MIKNRKKILVTGGLGYIGSHTIVKLFENNYQPIIIDNLSNSKIETLASLEEIVGEKITFYELDITSDYKEMARIMLKENIYCIIHFAGDKSVEESIENPLKYFENNVSGTVNLLKSAKYVNVKKIIFSSSATVYGEADVFPVTEKTQRKKPKNPYGESKYMCEDILESTSKSEDISCIALRYFNPIGAHASGKIFENPKNRPSNLIPFIQKVIEKDIDKLKIFGNDYNTEDGTCVRDYIDVNDLAEAHVSAIKCDKKFEIYNVGSGVGFTVMEIINEFKSQGVEIPYEFSERRKGDVEKIFADITKIKEELGWTPKITLRESVKSILNIKTKKIC